jgi:hypothetical protein
MMVFVENSHGLVLSGYDTLGEKFLSKNCFDLIHGRTHQTSILIILLFIYNQYFVS